MISRTLPSPARLTLTVVALAALPGLWTPLAAQTLTGRVLDEVSEAPVIGVLVTVLDEDGDRVLQAESDSVGRYRLRLPRPGAYRLATERLGYERGETPLLDLSFEGGRALDLVVTPEPVALEGFEVTVSAAERMERTLAMFGVQPAALPNSRIVTTEEIEAVAGALDFGHILQRQNMAGVTVVRQLDREFNPRRPGICVQAKRGSIGCARIYLDGVPLPIDPRYDRSGWIDPASIEMMVVLKPSEAGATYGGDAANGIVLIFTRSRGW